MGWATYRTTERHHFDLHLAFVFCWISVPTVYHRVHFHSLLSYSGYLVELRRFLKDGQNTELLKLKAKRKEQPWSTFSLFHVRKDSERHRVTPDRRHGVL